MSILPRAPGVIDPAGIAGKIATAMHCHQLQIGEARQRSGKDQVVKRERGIEWISQDIVEIEMSQSFAMGESVWMHHNERPELLGLRKERPEFWIGQFLAIDIGQDLDALQR